MGGRRQTVHDGRCEVEGRWCVLGDGEQEVRSKRQKEEVYGVS